MWGVLLSGFQSVVLGQQLQHHPQELVRMQIIVLAQGLLQTPGGAQQCVF